MSKDDRSKRMLGAGISILLLGLALWLLVSGLKGQGEEAGRSEGARGESENFASLEEKSRMSNQEVKESALNQKAAKSKSFERKVVDEAASAFPMATSSIKPNTVISPYPPYSILDTTGMESDDELIDPSTIPIDPETGKQMKNKDGTPDLSKAKRFRVP